MLAAALIAGDDTGGAQVRRDGLDEDDLDTLADR